MMASPLFLILLMLGVLSKGESKSSWMDSIKCHLAGLNYLFFGRENDNINYYFFSRTNPDVACDLQPTKEALKKCGFNSSLDTKVMIHGWIAGLPAKSFFFPMKDEFLVLENLNVIVVNWTAFTQNIHLSFLGYSGSAIASAYVGRKISAWVYFLQLHAGADPNKFHFLPFSMGCAVTSFAAKTMCGLKHITFFDPAAPWFRFLPSFLGPSPEDAHFVEAIHTDAAIFVTQGYGFLRPVADIDYYPNGGNEQPKCHEGATFFYGDGTIGTVNDSSTSMSCKHNSVFMYYLASFDEDCKFLGLICKNYKEYLSGKCSSPKAPTCRMGYYSYEIKGLPARSKCYLKTSADGPYCIN